MPTATPQLKLALRNVLVATDFSPCSGRAVSHALAAAQHFGSTLHILHVVQPGIFSMLPPDAYMGTQEAIEIALTQADAAAHKRLNEILQRAHCEDLKHRIWVRESPAVGETVRAMVQREHIDLAVVGTHGRTGLRRMVMGSVAEDVFRNASCPVLTVGPHSWRCDPPAVQLKHLLFPTDFSKASERALPIAMAIAADFGATLTVATILDPLEGEAAHDSRRVVSALQERMREMVSVVAPVPSGTTFRVEFGNVAEKVIECVDRLAIDLVVFGLKAPDTYVDRLPWAHAYKIVCEASCPVLSLRGPSS
jgi:nucleotide-binding universal stress UspA family protein